MPKPKHATIAGYIAAAPKTAFAHVAPLPKALIAKLARQRIKELRENDARWM